MGRARRNNEDAKLARSPLFAVADGMGGAQAGEVASGMAVTVLEHGLPDGSGSVEERLASLVGMANEQIHDAARADATRSGMGTTLTAAYVDEDDLVVAHVGDSRLYCLRDGALERLTRDHSLVEELVQEGRLTPEEAEHHPQRSIVTRVLGIEPSVVVDRMTWRAQAGDVYLICSDGLTGMVREDAVAQILRKAPGLGEAGRALVDAANGAGGRDNITVVLFRLAEADDARGRPEAAGATMAGGSALRTADVRAAVAEREATGASPPPLPGPGLTVAQMPAQAPSAIAPARAPQPRPPQAPSPRRRARKVLKAGVISLVVLLPIAIGAFFATQSVFFVGTDDEGLVTLYRGLPYDGPAGVRLYSENYVSGVPAGTLPGGVRKTVAAHELRSREDAADLVTQIEQRKLTGQER